MALTKLPSLSIVITLSFQSVLVLGETFLPQETNKDGGLKITEKRVNNFRVPMETPYDPNFWPARGRRSRRDPDKPSDDCAADDSYPFDKTRTQCREEKSRLSDLELMPPIELADELFSGLEKTDSCKGASFRVGDRPKGRLSTKTPDSLEERFWGRFDESRHKKQKHSPPPQLILYGNGVYWEPENLFGEKKKKQDVFWVARGKKNLNLNYPLK